VKVYVDTNILVAASVQEHQHHAQAFELVRKIKEGALQGYIITHGLAEFYSVLTRAPFSPRVHPAEAGRFLEDNILPHFELVALSPHDYKAVLSICAKAGLVGGVVFDALHPSGSAEGGMRPRIQFQRKGFPGPGPQRASRQNQRSMMPLGYLKCGVEQHASPVSGRSRTVKSRDDPQNSSER